MTEKVVLLQPANVQEILVVKLEHFDFVYSLVAHEEDCKKSHVDIERDYRMPEHFAHQKDTSFLINQFVAVTDVLLD